MSLRWYPESMHDGKRLMIEGPREALERLHYPIEVMRVVRALVRGVPAESAVHRRDDGRARVFVTRVRRLSQSKLQWRSE